MTTTHSSESSAPVAPVSPISPSSRGFVLRSLAASLAVAGVAISAGVGAGDYAWNGPLDSVFETTGLPPLPETVAIHERIQARHEARLAEEADAATASPGTATQTAVAEAGM